MQKVLGEHYFIDLDKIEEYLDITEIPDSSNTGTTELKVNVIKFEMIKLLLETILTEQDLSEDKLGIKQTNPSTSIPFKLAFNSLLNKKLINHY